MIEIAYAMGGEGITGGAKGFGAFIPLVLMFVIFYFLLIRPQQKKAKDHKETLSSLRKGDNVVTNGGLHGKITSMNEAIVTLEIADKVRVKISRSQIAGMSNMSSKEILKGN